MTLHLLIAGEPVQRTVILADPAARNPEPVVAALLAQLAGVRWLMFPMPDDTTRRHPTTPALARSRHADLWHGLDAGERARVLLAAGPSAGYLAPVVGSEATTLVAVRDPTEAAMPSGAWRSVLGPFAELDEVPEETEEDTDRERWFDRIRTATADVTLVDGGDLAAITAEAAAAVGLGPQRAARAARAAAAGTGEGRGPRRRERPVHWLDQALYSLVTAPEQSPPPMHRRG